ncbi:hypothetical protein BDQ94DRAFT_145016 [Aspergillus welwitschiae]|uniref:Uncharacterized protein n=1 Tax=Aspergillus welwitschiae TaxID=1341132 RepID=A0A3F3Q0P6_9EURO|nr:hypothetical protein BDQ94DRAFT_145016 [Aspergillus welwitschiae]RDH32779.1 hypothetical protein BDQ94DRAFT_145016 [Aspergillus welwitschiae]
MTMRTAILETLKEGRFSSLLGLMAFSFRRHGGGNVADPHSLNRSLAASSSQQIRRLHDLHGDAHS